MQPNLKIVDRRTSADDIFDFLNEEIGSLRLLPGTKISEADIAAKFDVSRQPVRDAFNRLSNLDLVQIRPQRATIVRKFSLQTIERARFVRLSVELEVLRNAARHWDSRWLEPLQASIGEQKTSLAKGDVEAFHQHDYVFHELLCQVANAAFAFEVIQANKAIVDRLCLLSLTKREGRDELIIDHENMIERMQARDADGLCDIARLHLSRLDKTIQHIHEEHSSYFDE